MKQATELSFEGQNIYCGIDVHKKNWSVCIRDESFELKTFSQPPEVETLVTFLQQSLRAIFMAIPECMPKAGLITA